MKQNNVTELLSIFPYKCTIRMARRCKTKCFFIFALCLPYVCLRIIRLMDKHKKSKGSFQDIVWLFWHLFCKCTENVSLKAPCSYSVTFWSNSLSICWERPAIVISGFSDVSFSTKSFSFSDHRVIQIIQEIPHFFGRYSV